MTAWEQEKMARIAELREMLVEERDSMTKTFRAKVLAELSSHYLILAASLRSQGSEFQRLAIDLFGEAERDDLEAAVSEHRKGVTP